MSNSNPSSASASLSLQSKQTNQNLSANRTTADKSTRTSAQNTLATPKLYSLKQMKWKLNFYDSDSQNNFDPQPSTKYLNYKSSVNESIPSLLLSPIHPLIPTPPSTPYCHNIMTISSRQVTTYCGNGTMNHAVLFMQIPGQCTQINELTIEWEMRVW